MLKTKKNLGILLPGILVAATGVGAGDLITAGLAGMRTGTTILWAVVLGVILKWVLTEGIARWQLATGTTVLEGWVNRLGPWIQWVFLVYLLLWSFIVGGALVNACGAAGAALVPVGPFSKLIWGLVHTVAGFVLIRWGGFKFFEKAMAISIGIMFTMVLLTFFMMSPDWLAIGKGLLVPVFPNDSLKWVLGLLGGVGGTVTVMSYGYWIREKGRTGKEGLNESRLDLAAAYILTGLFSIAMVVIASKIPVNGVKGIGIVVALADQLGGVLGPGARTCFLLGFWAAVFSSLLGVWQGVPYLFADFMSTRSHKGSLPSPEPNVMEQSREYRWYLLGLSFLPLITLWMDFETVQVTYAVMGAFFMPLLAFTLLLLNNRTAWVGRAFRNGWRVNVLLILTLLLFAYTGFRKIRGTLKPKPVSVSPHCPFKR